MKVRPFCSIIHSLLTAVIILAGISCKKAPENLQSAPSLVIQESIRITTGETFVGVSYSLSSTTFEETGLYFSTDSTNLVESRENTSKIISAKSVSGNFTATLTNQAPGTNYYYIIYIKHPNGTYTFSAPTKVTTQGYAINWEPGFSRQIKLIDILYKDVILVSPNTVNTETKNYKVTLGSIPCQLWKIAKDVNSSNYLFYVQVPAPTPVGKYRLSLAYLDKVVFSGDLEVLKGNYFYLSKVTQHPFPSTFAYFQFNNHLYTVDRGSDRKLNNWNSVTNQWTNAGTVPSEIHLTPGASGSQINNKIWFPPFDNPESFYTYTPSSGTWAKVLVPNTKNLIKTYDHFVYQEKIYCMSQYGDITNRNVLKVFDPSDKSWKVVMNLPDNVADIKGIVVNGKAYVLIVTMSSYEAGSMYWKSTLYELDLVNLSLIKKPDITWYDLPQGSLNPRLFAYRNHLFVYGGLASSYFVSTDMYEFAPENNSWTRIHLSPNSGIGGNQAFCNVFNDKIYIAFGQQYMFVNSNDIWELDMNK